MVEVFTITASHVLGVLWLVMWLLPCSIARQDGEYTYWSRIVGVIIGLIAGIGFGSFVF